MKSINAQHMPARSSSCYNLGNPEVSLLAETNVKGGVLMREWCDVRSPFKPKAHPCVPPCATVSPELMLTYDFRDGEGVS